MSNKPVIGVTLDWDDSPTYSKMYSWYALRTNYTGVISQNGAVPITLPYDEDAIDAYVSMIDGLVITGGDYDLDPSVYGDEISLDTRVIKTNRTDFEINLIKTAIKKNIPILGICAGHQLLAAIYGGKLHQDIKTYNPKALEHEQAKLGIHMSKPSHMVEIFTDTLLYNIVGKNQIQVNSSHHQAVKEVGDKMRISARAPDDIIEAIELIDYPFGIGVEWHPEYLVTNEDELIIKAFIRASSKNG